MKITTIFLVCVVCCLSASTYAQSYKVSINKQNSTIIDILKEIEDVSEFTFFFNDNRINAYSNASVNVQNASIEDVLTQVLKNTGYEYQIIDRQVLLKVAETGHPSVAQTGKRVTGVITDNYGDPVIGANVSVKNTTVGTITDIDGRFAMQVSDNAILVISYIGYITQEIEVGSQTALSVVLLEDSQALDEVVVVGYGTARKSDLTGSISSIKGETLVNRSTQQLSTAMQGQMAGVQVTRDNGGPGASATVRVRGVTTISNNDPLVIVDGVPSSLNDVISADVETMTVLKDAASASIYGSRAAAGVILITTKRAKDRQFSFDYNYEYAIDKPTTRPKNGNVIDWMNIQNELSWNDGASDPIPNTHRKQSLRGSATMPRILFIIPIRTGSIYY